MKRRLPELVVSLFLIAGTAACGDDKSSPTPDAGTPDAVVARDMAASPTVDAPLADARAVDVPTMDAPALDTPVADAPSGDTMDAGGDGLADSGSGSLFHIVATFTEPMTQPNNTIFTGTFTFDPVAKAVTGLSGSLTQSMTKVNGVYGGPMTTVALTHQLSSVPATIDGVAGQLVATFALNTTDTFTGGGFTPGGTEYFGLKEGTPNNNNAYALIFVNTTDPTLPLTQGQLDKLAYADCTTGGMMMKSCMTGTSVAGYGRKGTMGAYPSSQVIQQR